MLVTVEGEYTSRYALLSLWSSCHNLVELTVRVHEQLQYIMIIHALIRARSSLVAQLVKNPAAVWETWV